MGNKISVGISGALLISMITGAWALASQMAVRPTRNEVATELNQTENRLRTEQKEQADRTEKRLDKIDDKLDLLLEQGRKEDNK